MRVNAVDPNALVNLPRTIWMAGQSDISVYRGSPLEMVHQMAAEMGSASVHETVGVLLTSLYRNRGVLIAIPEDAPDEVLSALFVFALLNTGVGHPMAQS